LSIFVAGGDGNSVGECYADDQGAGVDGVSVYSVDCSDDCVDGFNEFVSFGGDE
jgi:hypothetical protein